MADDGSIHINTKIDASGVNTGTKQIGNAIEKNIAKPTQSLTKSFGGILNVVKGIGKALIAAFVGGAILSAIKNVIGSFDILGSSVGEKFQPLADALETLKGSFVNLIVQALIPAIPYLVEFANWLNNILQIATQVVAALFGFDKTVGGIMSKAASGAKKTAKEAKGALAAFDQINLLQKQEKPEETEGASITPGPLGISQEAQEIANTIKDWIDNPVEEFKKFVFWDNWVAFFQGVIDKLKQAWEDFKDFIFLDRWIDLFQRLWDNMIATWGKIFENIKGTLAKIGDAIKQVFQGIKDFITGVFTGDWALAWEGLKNIVTGIFDAIWAIVEGTLTNISLFLEGWKNTIRIVFGPVLEFLVEIFAQVAEKIAGAIAGVQATFGALAKWFFENVWNPIEAGFGSAMTGIKQGFEQTFNGIKTLVKGIINTIIDYINGMIEGIVFGINTVIGSANAVAGLVGLPEIQSVNAPKIPRLATGAVIPPNSEFLAVLGDQRGGKNIEAPAAMFEEMLQRAVQSSGGQNITIRFEGTMGELVRQLKPHIDRENVRVGNSLAKSSVVKI